jgi:hypothetical protein
MTAARRRSPLGADLRILILGILAFLLQTLRVLATGRRKRGMTRS